MAKRRRMLSSCPIIFADFCNNLTVPLIPMAQRPTSTRRRNKRSRESVFRSAVLLSHVGASYRNFLEIVMFAFLLEYLGRSFEHAEQRRKDEYLAGARD